MDPTPLFRAWARWRHRQLARMDPAAAQARTLRALLRRGARTRFGRDHGLARVLEAPAGDAAALLAAYRAAVPPRPYEAMWREYWQPAFPVLDGVSWPGRTPFLAVTSGTTSGRTKYIPVTPAMRRSNLRASLDVIGHHLLARPESRAFAGRSFLLGGSTHLTDEAPPGAPRVRSGDLSGIAAATMPRWAQRFAFPPPELALMADWEAKLERTARASLGADIRVLTGTPSWLLILLERVRALRGGAPPYPDLELLVHGGVNFAPYRNRFAALLAGTRAETREVYPASEGFIAGAHRGPDEGMRLNLDNGLFHEFIPVEELDAAAPTRHWIGDAEPGVNYALALTTCAGLWSYVLGDTVRLVGRDPPRLRVTGRTAYGLSAFGEHLIAEEIEAAMAHAAASAGLDVTDWLVGPVFPAAEGELGRHRYLVEFAAPPGPEALARFGAALDAALLTANDDYRAHRAGMAAPEVVALPPGAFAAWMKARGRLGGQNKVPRVVADAARFADYAAALAGGSG